MGAKSVLNLIKLELKKNKFYGQWLGLLIANAAILALVALIYFDPGAAEEEMLLLSYADAFAFIDTVVRATFTIYASALIAKFVIDEYKNKTIALMFTYPTNRKKLMASKLVIVFVWTIFAILLSNFVIGSLLVLLNQFVGHIPDTLTADTLAATILQTLLFAVAAAGLSLITLFFGMWKKSVTATIVSAVLIVSVVNSSTGGFSLYSIIAIPLTLAAIGIFIAYLSIRNVDKEDLI